MNILDATYSAMLKIANKSPNLKIKKTSWEGETVLLEVLNTTHNTKIGILPGWLEIDQDRIIYYYRDTIGALLSIQHNWEDPDALDQITDYMKRLEHTK